MLATFAADYGGELRADFQQFYNLNLDDMGTGYTYAHAAVLAEQLPRESRVLRKVCPDFLWGDEERLLSRIDYLLRILVWQRTEDGHKGRNKPEPPITPKFVSEEEKHEITVEKMESVAEALGIEVDLSFVRRSDDGC